MSAREKLAELRELAEKATPGPWALEGGGEWLAPLGIDVGSEDESSRPTLQGKDAEFIAESRTEMPKLVGALEALLDQHRPFVHHFIAPPAGSVEICDECRSSWPCATARLIEEALR